MYELFCETFVLKMNEKFQSQKCLFVLLFNGNKCLQKDINDTGAGDGKSNSFSNGLLLLLVHARAGQTKKPSNKVTIMSVEHHIFSFFVSNFYLNNLPRPQYK